MGLFASCTEVVDLDVDEVPKELVINCLFTENRAFEVNVSKLTAYTDLGNRNIENALVTIYENGNNLGILKHTANGIYTNHSFLPERGNQYSIEVEVEGYPTATANDSLPEIVPIEECIYTPEAGKDNEGDYYNEVAVTFTDKPGASFYSIRVMSEYEKDVYDKINGTIKSPIELSTNDPAILSEGVSKSDYKEFFVFNDALFSEQKYKTTVKYFYGNADGNIRAILESGTKNYYQYHKRLSNHETYESGDPFKPYSPIRLFSNIKGGQGIFAGYQRDVFRIKTH